MELENKVEDTSFKKKIIIYTNKIYNLFPSFYEPEFVDYTFMINKIKDIQKGKSA